MRAEVPKTYEYPQSEVALAEWEQNLLDENPGATVVKLAFERLAFNDKSPAQHAAQEDDFYTARELYFEQEVSANTFVQQLRPHTDAGHRFVRFHAVQFTEQEHQSPPSMYGGYWRRLSICFSYVNGPLGGEETYAVSPNIASEAKLHTLPREAHVVLAEDGTVAGVSSVAYTQDKTAIAERTFYSSERLMASYTGHIAKELLATAALQKYRLPYAEPPQAVQQALGLQPLPETTFTSPQSFNDLLPPAFRW